jgi:protoporphyrinogen oxidase
VSMDRRDFIKITSGAAVAGSLLFSCKEKKNVKGSIIGASANVGHLLRDKNFSAPDETLRKKIVIVGGGVSGLSAAYHLQKEGENDFLLFDLEKETGGNSRHGRNAVSAYPWGAHYITIPNNSLTEYLDFLKACGVVTGTDGSGLPVYNEAYLCFDPQERLYINGRWQDGLVPHYGLSSAEQQQVQHFLALMNQYRYQKGADGKEAFAIPVDASSKDKTFTRLDSLTMKEWLSQNDFTSPALHWYVNYCTRDDFGTTYDTVSAWMGIHYFASRKGKGANAEHSDVLTWPEGNGFLVAHLSKTLTANTRTGCLIVNVTAILGGVNITFVDTNDGKLKVVAAEQCILAIPQFVASRILKDEERIKKVGAHLHYTPWMVANLTVNTLEERAGAPLSWDNVLYDSPSLGYVEATHELVQQRIPKRNLTYYLPLTGASAAEERKRAQQRSYEEWVSVIVGDLKKVHPDIEDKLEELNIMIWGHAMAQPLPGLVHGSLRKELAASLNGNLHFAHTDLAGASIFEEAFYQGLNAANKVLQNGRAHA